MESCTFLIDKDPEKAEESLRVMRSKVLERNRQAAIKSRQKKKAEMQRLSVELEEKEKQHDELFLKLNTSRKERDELRNLLFTHRNCTCDVIGTYEQLLRLHRKGEPVIRSTS